MGGDEGLASIKGSVGTVRVVASLIVLLRDVGPELFGELTEIFPKGVSRPRSVVYLATLPSDSVELERIVARLESAGFEPWIDTFRPRKTTEYDFELRRYYDDEDLSAAPLLELGFTFDHPPAQCESSNERRELILTRHPNRDIAYAISSCLTIVTDPVRRTMEVEGFANDVIFLPTEKKDRPGVPVWQMRSRRTLPPVSPSMTLALEDGTLFQGQYERRCIRHEGLFHGVAELHYRAADLDAMGPFDVAHTKEYFGECPLDDYRPLVVSARFYEMCKRHKFKGGFTPVRIDA